MPEPLNYNKVVVQFKDLVESMAYIALTKMRKPSPYALEDLHQEGYIVCTEWVQRWFHPERGASLKTFITGGLRNRFADLVRLSFRDNIEPGWSGGDTDEDGYTTDPVAQLRNTDHDPVEEASFKETIGHLSEQELQYITSLLTPKENHRMPTRIEVRKKLGLSEDAELKVRNSIEKKLIAQVQKI